jgi:hypothetical protein
MADWGEERWSTASVWFGEQGEEDGWIFFSFFLLSFCALGRRCALCSASTGCAGLNAGSYTVRSNYRIPR